MLNPSAGSRVKGTLTITAIAEDESERVFMQLFVDDQLLSSEYTKQIETNLDTKTISDGIHKIVVNAKDENGNASSKEFSFEVRNTLMTIEVPSDYVSQFGRTFYLVSTNNGDIIAYGEVENESVISVLAPEDFNLDSSFVYNDYYLFDDGYLSTKVGNSYAAMTAGCYKYSEVSRSSPVTGTHKLKVTEVPINTEIRAQGRSVSTIRGFSVRPNIFMESDLSMFDTSSDLFLDAVDISFPSSRPPRYYYKKSIQTNASTNVSLDDFPVMDEHSIPLREPVVEYVANVEGYFEDDLHSYTVSSFYGLEQSNTAEVYAPANLFKKLKTNIILVLEGGNYTNDIISSSVPSSFQYMDVKLKDINRSENHVQIKTSGEFDILTVNAMYANYTGAQFLLKNFSYHFPDNVKKLTIPKSLPQEFIDLGFEELTTLGFTSASFLNYFDIDGSDDYRNYIVFSADGKSRGSRPRIGKTENLAPAATGRMNIQSNKKLAEVKPLLERLDLHHIIR